MKRSLRLTHHRFVTMNYRRQLSNYQLRTNQTLQQLSSRNLYSLRFECICFLEIFLNVDTAKNLLPLSILLKNRKRKNIDFRQSIWKMYSLNLIVCLLVKSLVVTHRLNQTLKFSTRTPKFGFIFKFFGILPLCIKPDVILFGTLVCLLM